MPCFFCTARREILGVSASSCSASAMRVSIGESIAIELSSSSRVEVEWLMKSGEKKVAH
jgi:hypothetical protein